MNKKPVLLCLLLFLFSRAYALDFWQYPEMAEKHSLFFGCLATVFSFTDYFAIKHPEFNFYLDYLLPVGLPFSCGASTTLFDQDLLRFGARIGYHVNVNDENTDLYVVYTLDYVSNLEARFLEYGGRIGVRRRLGQFICFTIETGFKLLTINVGISIKLN